MGSQKNRAGTELEKLLSGCGAQLQYLLLIHPLDPADQLTAQRGAWLAKQFQARVPHTLFALYPAESDPSLTSAHPKTIELILGKHYSEVVNFSLPSLQEEYLDEIIQRECDTTTDRLLARLRGSSQKKNGGLRQKGRLCLANHGYQILAQGVGYINQALRAKEGLEDQGRTVGHLIVCSSEVQILALTIAVRGGNEGETHLRRDAGTGAAISLINPLNDTNYYCHP